jgi:hypothetical protein
MKPEISTVKLSKIIFDEKIYPRQKHDPALVQRYTDALESIELKRNYISISKDCRLLDGRHRQLAYQTVSNGNDRDIPVYIYPVTDNDELFDLAVELNSYAGWQMTDDDKRRAAVKMYARAERKPQEDIARLLGVSSKKINGWLSDILKQEKEEREAKMLDMWLRCYSNQEIAAAVHVDDGDVSRFLTKTWESFSRQESQIFGNFEPELYSVWNFAKATNEIKHPGNIPPEICDNLLYYYTKPGDVVFDPFGGGGSTLDMCEKRKRRCYISDLNPIPARERDIRQHDITTGLPANLPVPDLVFLDPPYWWQAKEKYSKDATDLGNVDLEVFLTTIGNIARDVKRKWMGAKRESGYLSLIVGPCVKHGEKTDLALLCYERISKYLPIVERIIVPYSTQCHGGDYVNKAKQGKKILYLHRDLMVFKWKQ